MKVSDNYRIRNAKKQKLQTDDFLSKYDDVQTNLNNDENEELEEFDQNLNSIVVQGKQVDEDDQFDPSQDNAPKTSKYMLPSERLELQKNESSTKTLPPVPSFEPESN